MEFWNWLKKIFSPQSGVPGRSADSQLAVTYFSNGLSLGQTLASICG